MYVSMYLCMHLTVWWENLLLLKKKKSAIHEPIVYKAD